MMTGSIWSRSWFICKFLSLEAWGVWNLAWEYIGLRWFAFVGVFRKHIGIWDIIFDKDGVALRVLVKICKSLIMRRNMSVIIIFPLTRSLRCYIRISWLWNNINYCLVFFRALFILMAFEAYRYLTMQSLACSIHVDKALVCLITTSYHLTYSFL